MHPRQRRSYQQPVVLRATSFNLTHVKILSWKIASFPNAARRTVQKRAKASLVAIGVRTTKTIYHWRKRTAQVLTCASKERKVFEMKVVSELFSLKKNGEKTLRLTCLPFSRGRHSPCHSPCVLSRVRP